MLGIGSTESCVASYWRTTFPGSEEGREGVVFGGRWGGAGVGSADCVLRGFSVSFRRS